MLGELEKRIISQLLTLMDIKISQQDLIDAVDKVKPRKKEAPIPQSIK